MASTAATMDFNMKTTKGKPFTISGYMGVSGDVVGTYGTLDMNQSASASSPNDAYIAENCYIVDFVAGAATGKIELIVNGRKTGVILNNASSQAANPARQVMANPIPIAGGSMLRIQVSSAFP